MIDTLDLNRLNSLIKNIDSLEAEQNAQLHQKENLENKLNDYKGKLDVASSDLDLTLNAINILRTVSDDAVKQSYEFIQESVNTVLSRVFENSERKILLKESTLRGQYPQLEIQLYVEGGKTRSLKADSGHGLMQIISLLCVLSLIVITNSRRLLVIDEVLSGLSAKSREILAEVLEAFTTIGFQFVVNDHGFIPKGSYVVHLEVNNGISSVKETYIEERGLYLDYNSENE